MMLPEDFYHYTTWFRNTCRPAREVRVAGDLTHKPPDPSPTPKQRPQTLGVPPSHPPSVATTPTRLAMRLWGSPKRSSRLCVRPTAKRSRLLSNTCTGDTSTSTQAVVACAVVRLCAWLHAEAVHTPAGGDRQRPPGVAQPAKQPCRRCWFSLLVSCMSVAPR